MHDSMHDATGTNRNIRADLGQLRLIGRLSLWLGMIALTGLVIVYIALSRPGENYLQNILNLAISRDTLPGIMLMSGLLLILVTSIATWLTTLYISFRIAGPLYRFTRNIEAWLNQGSSTTIPLRKDDALQEESRLMQTAIRDYNRYLEEYRSLLSQAMQATRSGDITQLNQHLELLRQHADQASLPNHVTAP